MVEQRIQQPCDAQGITRSAPCRQFCPSDYFREIKDFVMTNFTRALVRILILICCLCICTLAMISFPQEGLKDRESNHIWKTTISENIGKYVRRNETSDIPYS